MEKVKKPILKRKGFWFLLIIAIIIIAASSGGKDSGSTTTSNNSVGSIKEDTKVNYENFIKIKMGATYDDVKGLFGEGKEQSSLETNGIKSVIYEWSGAGISRMNITIDNNVVTGKAQMGLKDMDSEITLAKYNEVKDGMTYDQVKAIIGEGQISSQVKIDNMESIIYEWINKDGSNANLTFTGGKLQMKAQFNLK